MRTGDTVLLMVFEGQRARTKGCQRSRRSRGCQGEDCEDSKNSLASSASLASSSREDFSFFVDAVLLTRRCTSVHSRHAQRIHRSPARFSLWGRHRLFRLALIRLRSHDVLRRSGAVGPVALTAQSGACVFEKSVERPHSTTLSNTTPIVAVHGYGEGLLWVTQTSTSFLIPQKKSPKMPRSPRVRWKGNHKLSPASRTPIPTSPWILWTPWNPQVSLTRYFRDTPHKTVILIRATTHNPGPVCGCSFGWGFGGA